jgi:hypothetical protein
MTCLFTPQLLTIPMHLNSRHAAPRIPALHSQVRQIDLHPLFTPM